MARAAKVRLAAKKPVKRVVYLLWHCYEYPSGRTKKSLSVLTRLKAPQKEL